MELLAAARSSSELHRFARIFSELLEIDRNGLERLGTIRSGSILLGAARNWSELVGSDRIGTTRSSNPPLKSSEVLAAARYCLEWLGTGRSCSELL